VGILPELFAESVEGDGVLGDVLLPPGSAPKALPARAIDAGNAACIFDMVVASFGALGPSLDRRERFLRKTACSSALTT
jgi:hypothetical protein